MTTDSTDGEIEAMARAICCPGGCHNRIECDSDLQVINAQAARTASRKWMEEQGLVIVPEIAPLDIIGVVARESAERYGPQYICFGTLRWHYEAFIRAMIAESNPPYSGDGPYHSVD